MSLLNEATSELIVVFINKYLLKDNSLTRFTFTRYRSVGAGCSCTGISCDRKIINHCATGISVAVVRHLQIDFVSHLMGDLDAYCRIQTSN